MKAVVLFFVAALLLGSVVNAQSGEWRQYNWPMYGTFWGMGSFIPATRVARVMGMAGLHSPTVVGAEALLKNPAGLAFGKSAEVNLGGRANLFGSHSNEKLEAYYPSWKTDIGFHPDIWDVTLATPFRFDEDFIAGFGLGWNTYYDNGNSYATVHTGYGYPDSAEYTDTRAVNMNAGWRLLSPAAAVNYKGKYALGFSYGFALGGDGRRAYKMTTAYPETSYVLEEVYTYGTGGNLLQVGLQAKPIDKLTVGFVFTGAHTICVHNEQWETPGENDEGGEIGFDVYVPAHFTVGVTYDVTPLVLVGTEFETRPLRDITAAERGWYDMESESEGIEDGFGLRFAAEYHDNVAVRLGFGIENFWQRAEWADSAAATLIVIAAGGGMPAGPLRVNLGFEYGMATTGAFRYTGEGPASWTLSTGLLRAALDVTMGMPLLEVDAKPEG